MFFSRISEILLLSNVSQQSAMIIVKGHANKDDSKLQSDRIYYKDYESPLVLCRAPQRLAAGPTPDQQQVTGFACLETKQ